jgi:hypothetical protein
VISNLKVRSNLLPAETYQRNFPNLSAMDLRSIHDRCRFLPISFDPSKLTLTSKQCAEWDARLFWGDNTVSLSDGDREMHWILELGEVCMRQWETLKLEIDVEEAFEFLWVLSVLKKRNLLSTENEHIENELEELLLGREYTRGEIKERLNSFYPELI